MNLLFFVLGSWMIPHASAQELTLHFIPSPTGVNWKSPQTLAVSVIKNQFSKHAGLERHEIGHVYVELNCGQNPIFTGMTTSSDTEERDALLKYGYGLGLVFKTYSGKLDDNEFVKTDLASQQAAGRSSFARFLISASTCSRLENYLTEFKARGYDKVYAGLNARPLDGEGSGCSAFGMSFLELAGIQTPEMEDEWMHSYIFPRKFVGGPLTDKKVSILRILFAFGSKWDKDLRKDGFSTVFWDPELMDNWTRNSVSNLENQEAQEFAYPARVLYQDQSPGIEFDARNVPTPTDEIFRVPAPQAPTGTMADTNEGATPDAGLTP
jgi:hypothetical protein